MTSLFFIPAFLLFLLPWLNPFAPGPSPPVMPWVIALMASGGLIGLGSLSSTAAAAPGQQPFARRWASPFAWALVLAGLASSAIGLLQFFGMAGPLEPWVRQGTFGEAFANLRQRNQFASLTNMALAALLWLAVHRRAALVSPGLSRLSHQRELAVLLAAALLAVGNAASSSRTGLMQLFVLCGLFWLWGGWRQRAAQRVLLVALVAYAASTWLLPWLAGFDPFDRSMFARLRDGDGVCESRRALWSNVIELIALKPWLGWGWGELDYAHYITLFEGVRFCAILDNAHNLPLHLAVELGVPVAVLVCGAIAWWAWRRQPWREADPTRQLAWAVLAVIGLHSLLEYPLWYGPFQMVAVVCVGLLWHREQPSAGDEHELNPSRFKVLMLPLAIGLIASSFYVAWDYYRISQLYLAPQDRDAAYVDDAVGKARQSRLFSRQVEFAELTTTPLNRSNAQSTFEIASALLHYSPEPRIIEKVIESAVILGRDEEAMAHLARYRAAFPKEHAAWARGNARMPEIIEGLNQPK